MKRLIVYSLVLWFVPFVFSLILFSLLGIDYSEHFGIGHPKYWTFEAIITPFFVIMSMIMFWMYYKKMELTEDWKRVALVNGCVVSAMQFVLDTLVIVLLFGNGFRYFYGLVTVSYLIVPLWSYLLAFLISG